MNTTIEEARTNAPVSNPIVNSPSPTKPRRPRRPRPLASNQVWKRVIRPLSRVRNRLGPVAEADPAIKEIVTQLDKMASELWRLHRRRELSEAQAKDAGEVCWQVFHPRGPTMFDLGKIVTRTPHTSHIKNEYFSITDSDPRVVSADCVWQDLDKELHREPLDLAKFRANAQRVDAAWRKHLAAQPEEAA